MVVLVLVVIVYDIGLMFQVYKDTQLMFACLFNAFNYFIKDLFPYLTRTSQLEFLEIASLGYKEE